MYDTNPFVCDDDSFSAIPSEQFAEEHLTEYIHGADKNVGYHNKE